MSLFWWDSHWKPILALAAGEKAVPSSSLVGAQETVGLCLEEEVGMEQRSRRGSLEKRCGED